ncbi:MAG: hypothetical protein ACPGC9_01990 [Cytophagales bacterium]
MNNPEVETDKIVSEINPSILKFLEHPSDLKVDDIGSFCRDLLDVFCQQMNADLAPEKRPTEVSFSLADPQGKYYHFFCKHKEVLLVKPYQVNGEQYVLIKPENKPCLSPQHACEWTKSPKDLYDRKERVVKDLPEQLGINVKKDKRFDKNEYAMYGISYPGWYIPTQAQWG